MDPLELQEQIREFDLFLSGGASTVPEPVYEREVRRHVDSYGNRTELGTSEHISDVSERVYFEQIEVDLDSCEITVKDIEVE